MRTQLTPLLYTLLALTACQADPVAPAPQAVAPRPAQGAAAPPAPPQLIEAPAWRWTHYGPDAIRRGAHSPAILIGADVVHIRKTSEPRRFLVERRRRDAARGDAQPSAPDVEPGWSFVVDDAPFVGDGDLAVAGDVVVVALYSRIATGCKLVGLDAATGAQRWEVALKGLGPVSHSKYRNDVQLDVVNNQVVVYGWESSGRYVEIVDPARGRILYNERVSSRWERWSEWGWIVDAAEATKHREGLIVGADVSSYIGPTALLNTWVVSRQRDERAVWSAQLERRGERGPAALAAAQEVVGVLYHEEHQAGGVVLGLDAGDGGARWETSLVGVGAWRGQAPGGAVQIAAQGAQLIVTGREPIGRYVEVLDAETGKHMWQERWFD